MPVAARLVLAALLLLALPTDARAQYHLDPGTCTAGTSQRWSGTTWSCETLAPLSASYWTGTANATLTGETDLGALTTGLILGTVSAGVSTPSAYAGTSCTNQFLRSLNASGAATCADVAAADFAAQTANTVLAGPTAAPAADPTFRALVDADIPAGIVRSTRTLNTTSPITGSGDLSADRTFACATCGVTGSPLSQFAATTSLQLLGVLSDETGTGALVFATAPTIAGGTHTALTGLGVRSTGTGAFDLVIANTENLTVSDKTLTITLNDANRTLTLSGNATVTGPNTGDQTITLTSDVTGSGSGSFATTIAANAVTDTKLRDSGALSVIGRSANSSGDPADISATAASDAVLRESGSTIGFGTVATGGLANNAVTYAKMQDVTAASRLLGRGSAAGSGDPEEITLGTNLSMSGTTLNATGGGSVTITQVEIDFDTCGLGANTAKRVCKVTVTDAAVSATSKLLITQAGDAATGRQEDENEMDPLVCRAAPAAGQFTLYCSPTEGAVAGKYKVNYTVG